MSLGELSSTPRESRRANIRCVQSTEELGTKDSAKQLAQLSESF